MPLGIWYTKFNTVDDVITDPQAAAIGVWTEVATTTASAAASAPGAYDPPHKFVANPVKLSESPELLLGRAPTVGQHTEEIMDELRRAGVISKDTEHLVNERQQDTPGAATGAKAKL